MIIYLTTNNINGKIYIGKYCGRDKKYIGSGKYLKNAINKYGRENFTRIILEDNILDHDYLCEREIYWIKKYDSTNPNVGYNISNGGNNMGGENNPMYGKTHSLESKEKISKNRRDMSGENNPFYGKTHSLESIKRMQEIKVGKYVGKKSYIYGKRGEECPNYGRKHTEEEIEKMRKVQSIKKEVVLKILNLLDKKISSVKIAKELNVCKNTVIKVKMGKYNKIYNLPERNFVEKNYRTKKEVIIKIIKLLDKGVLQKDIAKQLGIGKTIITKTKQGYYDDIYDLKD